MRARRHGLVRWLFLRALGGVYLAAFSSLAAQVIGLYGKRGILPIARLLEHAKELPARDRYLVYPSLFWLDASDKTLVRACRTGQCLSVLLMLGVAPRITSALLWSLYLSFVSVGRDFLAFQWDALLLESGAHAVLVAPPGMRPRFDREPSRAAVLMMRWLLFRLSFGSGWSKLRSGDPTWRDGTACVYHYETQPLPTRLGWYANQLPLAVQKASTAFAVASELGGSLLAFAPRRLRYVGLAMTSAMQLAIAATGNYGFFNLLTATIALWLLDDDAFARLAPHTREVKPALAERIVTVGAAIPVALLSAIQLTELDVESKTPPKLRRVWSAVDLLRSLNRYGLFSVMTTKRPEIVIEGSDDGETWRPYAFRYKPGDPRRAPRWVAPHQPRLDWQMWFAALSHPPPWFLRLLVRLLEGSPEVIGLLESTPFPGAPPRFVRALLYDYTMTDRRTRARTGAWWKREELGVYFPAVSLVSTLGEEPTLEPRPRRRRPRIFVE
jgi:hypothetical protein